MSTQTTPNITADFILAGLAIFTVANPTGERYTYKITKKDPDPGSRYQQPTYFVAVLTGSDNESDYTYLGLVSMAARTVITTKASRYAADSKIVRVAQWAVALLLQGKPVPAGYGIHHEGKCGRCGRTLTVPSSILSGIGPDCAQKMGLAPAAAPKADTLWPVDSTTDFDLAERHQGVQ